MRIARHIAGCQKDYRWSLPEDGYDYLGRFADLDEHMNENVHKYVNIGAAAAGCGWLTDHGPDHVSTVMRRIEDLTYKDGRCVLSPYETYLVLVAVHVHDVGNAYGRNEHEKQAKKMLFELPARYIGSDTMEKRMIFDIAMAHGGTIASGGNKDTIGGLRHDRRIKRLAAILRFADELADDNTRTSRFVIDAAGEVAPRSIAFHLYADRLRRPEINHDTSSVKLTFELQKEHLTECYSKGGSEVYLLDEIMERTLKTHREQVYCGKFMSPYVISERTEIHILVCTDGYADVLGSVSYILEQTGYPERIDNIASLVPELATLSGRSAAERAQQIFGVELDPGRNLIPVLSSDR